MADSVSPGGHQAGLGKTLRTDRWWFEATWTGAGFLIFVIYTTWAMLQGNHYFHQNYLSPFYSPVIFTDPSVPGAAPVEHALLGEFPDWLKAIWPFFLPMSPGILIAIGPLAFRMTCYYYRKFYYRAYFMTPPACAVGSRTQNYRGETALLLIQNLHRYTLYIAIAYIGILYYDAFLSFFREGVFGVGVGSIVLLLNPTLLGLYTFGCHAFRHLVGGQIDCYSCDNFSHTRQGIWKKVTSLNKRHMLWAWVSMIWVGLTDLYVRLVSMGIIHDFNTWGT